MDNLIRTKTINLNLKQIQTVGTTQHNNSNNLSSSNQSNDRSNGSLHKNNANKSGNNSSNFSTSNKTASNQSNQNTKKTEPNSTTNQKNEKKSKVPFELKPATNKVEPKYSRENTNLRLLNQVTDSRRKVLLESKVDKSLNDRNKNERVRNQNNLNSNLKSIDTSASSNNRSTAAVGKQQSNRNSSSNTNLSSSSNNNANRSKLDSSLPAKQARLDSNGKGTNRLVDFYLKCVPDQFNYLDDNSEGLESIELIINEHEEKKRANAALRKPSQQPIIIPSKKPESTAPILLRPNAPISFPKPDIWLDNNRQSADLLSNKAENSTASNNFSSEFLKNQKQSFEIQSLINFKISNEEEKNKVKNVIDLLMKPLVEYKRSSYPVKLSEELDDSINEIVKNS